MSFWSDGYILRSDQDNIIRLFNLKWLWNLQEEVITSKQTKSGRAPSGLTVTNCGDLIYTYIRVVNIMNKMIHEMMRLHSWKHPSSTCVSSSGDLLVILNKDNRETDVFRYSGSTKKQEIPLNEKGKSPIFIWSSKGHQQK